MFTFFASSIAEIAGRSGVAPGRELRWTVIANPRAGGFTIKKRWKAHEAALRRCAEKAEKSAPRRVGSGSRTADANGLSNDRSLASKGLVLTSGPGHAGRITGALIEEIRSEASLAARPFHLIITAGGDGTSLEVMAGLYRAGSDALANCAVLRLPMGTGNDGADAWDMAGALELLLTETIVGRARALRLVTASGKGPFLAFNILSVGLDAFVTHMTNRMKGRLPGDSYKLWVDIASLLYDSLYKVDYMNVSAIDESGAEIKNFREKLLLIAVGASGHRTYGSHKRILPDDRNVCALTQMPLIRKISFKELFNSGGHVNKKEAILFNARAVIFTGNHPILAQMDGEAALLDTGDFPASIELSDKLIPVLRRDADQGKKDIPV